MILFNIYLFCCSCLLYHSKLRERATRASDIMSSDRHTTSDVTGWACPAADCDRPDWRGKTTNNTSRRTAAWDCRETPCRSNCNSSSVVGCGCCCCGRRRLLLLTMEPPDVDEVRVTCRAYQRRSPAGIATSAGDLPRPLAFHLFPTGGASEMTSRRSCAGRNKTSDGRLV